MISNCSYIYNFHMTFLLVIMHCHVILLGPFKKVLFKIVSHTVHVRGDNLIIIFFFLLFYNNKLSLKNK
jgi:hypothetical protein